MEAQILTGMLCATNKSVFKKLFGSEFRVRRFESTPSSGLTFDTTSKSAAALQAYVLDRILFAQPHDTVSPAITEHPPLRMFCMMLIT